MRVMHSALAEPSTTTPERHVVLLGAMGVGKTTIGRALAEALRCCFLDSDVRLTELTGEDGRSIAAAKGVATLHELEARILHDALRESPPAVIAAAASVVDSDSAVAALMGHRCVWLRASDAVVTQRRDAGSHRRSTTIAERRQLVRREPTYSMLSGLHIDTGATDVAGAVAEITEWLGR